MLDGVDALFGVVVPAFGVWVFYYLWALTLQAAVVAVCVTRVWVVMTTHLTRRNVDYAAHAAFRKLGMEGCSTHSFRGSALSVASDNGVPLRLIRSISGHSSLDMLQRYLDFKDEQKRQAALAFD